MLSNLLISFLPLPSTMSLSTSSSRSDSLWDRGSGLLCRVVVNQADSQLAHREGEPQRADIWGANLGQGEVSEIRVFSSRHLDGSSIKIR